MDTLDVCPTEDALQALLEYLVDPLLPAKTSTREIPSQAVQEKVAKQVHAVVVLYNYYHRRKHLHLEYLCLEAFCKLAAVFKPSLLLHMKLMKESSYDGVNDLQEQTSLLERVIMDACNLCMSLDPLSGVPTIEEWPIQKVVVFLVDSTRKNCYLQHSVITQGVWSLIEKAIDGINHSSKCNLGQECAGKKKTTTKDQQRHEMESEIVFKKQALLALVEATGVNRNDVSILERHVVYSLSKERTAARFYIMQCTSEISGLGKVPIEDVISSLQGPLFEKSCSLWTITSVVEYFHILPFADILSDWFSRPVDGNIMKQMAAESAFADVEAHESTDVAEELDIRVTKKFASGPGSRANATSESTGNPMVSTESDCMGVEGNGMTEVAKVPKVHLTEVAPLDNLGSRRKTASKRTDDGNNCDAIPLVSGISTCFGVKDNRKREVAKEPKVQASTEVAPIGNAGRNRKNAASKSADDGNVHSGSPLLGSFDGQSNGDGNGCSSQKDGLYQNGANTVQARNSDKRMRPCEACCSSTKKNGSEPEPKVIQGVADQREIGVQKRNTVAEESHTITDNPRSIHAPDSAAVVTHNSNQNLDKLQAIIISKSKPLSDAALKVLLCKRNKLILQHRNIEDEIAKCDKNIQTLIEGGEDDWELKLESLVESCNNLDPRSIAREATSQQSPDKLAVECNKRIKLCEHLSRIKSPCQELDDLCYENNWLLPTYHVSLVDGGFEAEVRLQEMRSVHTACGLPRPKPQEARDSAAFALLNELRLINLQHQHVKGPEYSGQAS